MVKNVLIIVENCPAPRDTRIRAIALTLYAQNMEVYVISPREPGCKQTHGYLEDRGTHLYSYRLPQFASGPLGYLFEYALSMWQTWWLSLYVLYKHGFDVIHVANPPDMFFLLGLFYRLFGKHFVFDQHDLAPELFTVKFGKRYPILLKLLYWLEKCSYAVANLVLVTNQSQYDFAIDMKRGGCDPEKVCIVRNGPALEHFSRVPADLALKSGYPFLLVYVGRMEVQDGVEYALYAMHELVYTYGRRDTMLALLGDGNDVPRLKQLMHELDLEACVSFPGWVNREKVIRYLSTADIGLCPDPHNGLNEYSTTVKSMEYMALELPIVAFDLKEIRYTAQDAARYATPNSSQDFAKQIMWLLENPEKRDSMGKNARARVETCLSWDHSQQELLSAYAKILPDI